MARVRIEYLKNASFAGGMIVGELVAAIPEFSVGSSPTTSGDRPLIYAGITPVIYALDGPVYAAAGSDPTASPTSGFRIDPSHPRPLIAAVGKLSFVQASLDTYSPPVTANVSLAGDVEIGAVELKNETDDTRAKIGGGGAANALRTVLANDVGLPPGANEVGKTNIKHINVAGAVLTRPANVTPYSANDSISNHATAASVVANEVMLSDVNDDPVDLTEILLDTNDTGFAGVQVRLHLFNSDPTANTGVGAGDNAAYVQKKAGWVGSFTGTLVGFSDGARGTLISDGAPVRILNVESGGKRGWYQLQVLGTSTPSANSTTFVPRFKGYQGRV